jgi:hypothetical protein
MQMEVSLSPRYESHCGTFSVSSSLEEIGVLVDHGAI